MQNSISFSIESIISRRDPPKQTGEENYDSQGILSRGPLSAMQNLVELTPRGDGIYSDRTVSVFQMEEEKLDKHFRRENVMDHFPSSPTSECSVLYVAVVIGFNVQRGMCWKLLHAGIALNNLIFRRGIQRYSTFI